MNNLSRRDFLRLGGLALTGLAFSPFLPEFTQFEDGDLVRVATKSVSVYAQPTDKSEIVYTWPLDSVVHTYGQVNSGTPATNPIWYRVFGGYMNRARLQQVRVTYNQPLPSVPVTKLLVEVTVPYAQAYTYNSLEGWAQDFRLYYETVHWITTVEAGPDGQPWYRIQEEASDAIYFVPAVQVRPIPPEELTPLSPDVPMGEKRIDVNLTTQTLVCTEFGTPVFTTLISSGLPGLSLNESTATPTGEFNVQDKLPSKHMANGSLAGADSYDLPGVPWCSFFTNKGHALHGTYWHDNFGNPMSHGCINMRTADAEWLFRWVQPIATFDQINKSTLDIKGFGTYVEVHY
jgi:lipoprotein-anchoring transpeptidase ErfK/SrfK